LYGQIGDRAKEPERPQPEERTRKTVSLRPNRRPRKRTGAAPTGRSEGLGEFLSQRGRRNFRTISSTIPSIPNSLKLRYAIELRSPGNGVSSSLTGRMNSLFRRPASFLATANSKSVQSLTA